jgi:hypothetical protein
MSFLEDTKKRVQAFLDEAAHLAESEFPYPGSWLALQRLIQFFTARLATLNSFDTNSDPAVVQHTCGLDLQHQFNYLPLLGFVLRSTNVRNAFEVFRPLLRLAREILEPGIPKNNRKTELVLSSEWDHSPFVYPEVPELPGFVMIGIPAPESANPLVVPLAGHELGHSVWGKDNQALQKAWEPRVRQAVVAEITSRWTTFSAAFGLTISQSQFLTNVPALQATWFPSLRLALRQVEETFCDFLGLRLFGWAYLESFAYLLSPGSPGARPAIYPAMLDRIDNLLTASQRYVVTPSTGYRDRFSPSAPLPLSPVDAIRLEIADAARQRLISQLIAEAQQVVITSGVTTPTDTESDRIYERFKLVVPREKCKCIADILNGAWKAFRDPLLWQDNPQIAEKRDLVLKELVLKNLELFEIEQILKESP